VRYGSLATSLAGIPLDMASRAFSGELDLISNVTSSIESFERLDASYADRDLVREFGAKFLDPYDFLVTLARTGGKAAVAENLAKPAMEEARQAWERWLAGRADPVSWRPGGRAATDLRPRTLGNPPWEVDTIVWAPVRNVEGWAESWWVQTVIKQAIGSAGDRLEETLKAAAKRRRQVGQQ
jgi:hypothetical protein